MRKLWKRLTIKALALAGLTLLLLPALALADEPAPSVPAAGPVPSLMFWAGVLGTASMLVGYVVNHLGPWVSERVKLAVQLGMATGTGTIYVLIQTGDFAFDVQHLQVVAAAIFGAFVTHGLIYKVGDWNGALGAGRNLGDQP